MKSSVLFFDCFNVILLIYFFKKFFFLCILNTTKHQEEDITSNKNLDISQDLKNLARKKFLGRNKGMSMQVRTYNSSSTYIISPLPFLQN